MKLSSPEPADVAHKPTVTALSLTLPQVRPAPASLSSWWIDVALTLLIGRQEEHLACQKLSDEALADSQVVLEKRRLKICLSVIQTATDSCCFCIILESPQSRPHWLWSPYVIGQTIIFLPC